jgi:hypothetical protein
VLADGEDADLFDDDDFQILVLQKNPDLIYLKKLL